MGGGGVRGGIGAAVGSGISPFGMDVGGVGGAGALAGHGALDG